MDRARHRAICKEFEHCPSQEMLEESGAYDGPIKNGAYLSVRVLIHELKTIRLRARVTLATAKGVGNDLRALMRRTVGFKWPGPPRRT